MYLFLLTYRKPTFTFALKMCMHFMKVNANAPDGLD